MVDISAIQSEIAENVAYSLRVNLIPTDIERVRKRETEIAGAYSSYFRGRYLMSDRSERGLKERKKAPSTFVEPELTNVRSDPRYQDLLKRMNVEPSWFTDR